jgi:hypothetical protein
VAHLVAGAVHVVVDGHVHSRRDVELRTERPAAPRGALLEQLARPVHVLGGEEDR